MDALTLGLESLLVIAIVAYLAPFIASLIPGRPVPEAVFLVFAGALLGPHGVQFIDASLDSIQLLSQLGCAFLFLMAGYEIEVKKVTGPMGRHASMTWAFSLVIAILIVPLLPLGDTTSVGRLAFALAMTTTAYGTLAPIMRDRNLDGTPVGDAVTVYGATGEVLPVLAMGLLLSTRGTLASFISIIVYVLLCLFVLHRTKRAKEKGSRTVAFIGANEGTGAQSTVRITVLLLVFLVAMANDMHLDIVVGAFAAGFILRALIPDGNELLEGKLEAISFGFLVPLFFIVSGTTIDLAAVGQNPGLFVVFIGLLLLVRALPVFVSLRMWPESKGLSTMQRFSSSMYCSMALPVIVAVTSVAVEAGAMTETMASVLVTGGAFTVLAVPLITSVTRRIEAAHPVRALSEIADGTADVSSVVQAHRLEHEDAMNEFREARMVAHEDGQRLSSADYLAMRAHFQREFEERERKRREQAAEGMHAPIDEAEGHHSHQGEPDHAASKRKRSFDDPHELGFLRLVEIWFVTTAILAVVAAVYGVRSGAAVDVEDMVVFAVGAFNAVGFALIALRKKAARPVIIVLSAIAIVIGAATSFPADNMPWAGLVIGGLPCAINIVYFATSRRVRALLDRPFGHTDG